MSLLNPPATPAVRQRFSLSLRQAAFATTTVVYMLIVLGGVVRISGSGLGCGNDWPLCNGSLLPAMTAESLIEYAHRLVAAIVVFMLIVTACVAWNERKAHPHVARLAWLAAGIVVVQVLLGAITVWLDLHMVPLVAHLGTAQALLAVLLVVAFGGPQPLQEQPLVKAGQRRYRRLLIGSIAGLYGLLLLGGLVASTGAAYACGPEFPWCNQQLIPKPLASLAGIQTLHRFGAVAVGLLLLVLIRQTARSRWHSRPVRLASLALGGCFLTQAAIGASFVLLVWPPLLAALHLAVGTATWVSLVVLVVVAWNVPARLPEARPTPELVGLRLLLDDYIKLTKPGVISLLLVTTLAAMFVAGRPGVMLIFWTMLGGYLAAGGANAINCYMDRDVDVLMGRTARRPIPSNRIEPIHALIFGITLGTLSFLMLATFVNLLSAALALFALLFYVLVYTGWLKRSSTQNIVIGGAAGAIPPLIGWAAVTGEISLLAFFLFAIIFYWTPPHFWALALIRRDDYARANIPMLPVVHGEQETKWQILLYSLLLISITVLPTPFRLLGPVYLLGALTLGAVHMLYVWRLMRENGSQSAWKLYKFSLLYLALLFGAMVLDSWIMAQIV